MREYTDELGELDPVNTACICCSSCVEYFVSSNFLSLVGSCFFSFWLLSNTDSHKRIFGHKEMRERERDRDMTSMY